MDIQNLQVAISDSDLQRLAEEFQPKEGPRVTGLAVRATEEGVVVSGEAPTPMMALPFESVWRPGVAPDGRVAVHLVELRAAGFPATVFRTLVLGLLKDAVQVPFAEVTEEAILVDVQEFVRREKLPIPLRFEVRSVRCVAGGVVAEAGWPPQTGG